MCELTTRGWDTKKLAERCSISLGRAHNLISWHYPPTEKILRKLEKGLLKKRFEFWKDWAQQQRTHLRKRRYFDAVLSLVAAIISVCDTL